MALQKAHILQAAADCTKKGSRNTKLTTDYLVRERNYEQTFHPDLFSIFRGGLAKKVGNVFKGMTLRDLENYESKGGFVEVTAQEIYVQPIYTENEFHLDLSSNWYIPSIKEYRHAMELIVARPDLAAEAIRANETRMENDRTAHDKFVDSVGKYQ